MISQQPVSGRTNTILNLQFSMFCMLLRKFVMFNGVFIQEKYNIMLLIIDCVYSICYNVFICSHLFCDSIYH